MAVINKCPECGSNDVEVVNYRGSEVRICKTCEFDERDEFDAEGGEKSNQKAKGSYSPYHAGGPKGKR
jgi:hypothetical protein